jgi:hypothetical protein
MRTSCLVLAFAGTLAAQPPLVRGVLLELDIQKPAGEFSVRAPDNQVFRYRFDAKTYVEREERLIEFRRLQPGEKVEVVSDLVPGSAIRYARTVHVLEDAPVRQSLTGASRLRSYRLAPAPTGNLTYSGVVVRLTDERLVLRTRAGEETLALRKDTRYLENGEGVEAATLRRNTRVFVRAGKDLYGQLEAYQVVWGAILDPK